MRCSCRTGRGSWSFESRPRLLRDVAASFELFDHICERLLVEIVRGLRKRLARVFESLLDIAVGCVAAGKSYVDGPRVAVALIVELEDIESLFVLLGGDESAAVGVYLERTGGAVV